MRTPTAPIDHEIPRPDDRVVAVTEWGDPAGRPVALFHMSPGSRLHDPDPAATAAAGVRLLTIDRPGYGRTSPVAGVPTIGHALDDAVAAFEALGVGPLDVVGWSGGGVRAAGLAALHPDVVRSLSLVATPAHDDDVAWIPEEFRPLTEAMRRKPEAALATFTEALSWYAADPASALAGVSGPSDAAVVQDPRHGPPLVAQLVEGARQGAGGLAADLVSQHVVPWGFTPADVGAPLHAWYGELDEVITLDHGRHWAATMPDARLHVLPGAGHLLAITVWADILAAPV